MKEDTIYSCEVCGFSSADRAEVEACEAVPVARADLKPGEIIAGVGHALGRWAFEPERSRDWLFDEPGDPASTNHHEAGKGGYVKWVVLDVVMPRDRRVDTAISTGSYWGHREVALLYTPTHPCYKNEGPAYAWAPVTEGGYKPKHRLGSVSPEDLERYRAAVNGKRALLI